VESPAMIGETVKRVLGKKSKKTIVAVLKKPLAKKAKRSVRHRK
jgi:hypothetical protein